LTATDQDLAALSDLCLRAKAVWGHDSAFLNSRRAELTLTRADLATPVAVVRDAGGFAGVAQLCGQAEACSLDKLFVDPERQRQGVGRALLGWACDAARAQGAARLLIDSDPGAIGFYTRHGAVYLHDVPSEPPAGRTLPRLGLTL